MMKVGGLLWHIKQEEQFAPFLFAGIVVISAHLCTRLRGGEMGTRPYPY